MSIANENTARQLQALSYSGSLSDMLYAFYKDQGAVGDTLNERAMSWLSLLGFNQPQYNDRWNAYLTSLGLSGSVSDMLYTASLREGGFIDGLSAAIKSMFASGQQGAWYDPSDLSTLFQDSAGTAPVTAVEQPVGLMLDKRLGLVRGAELATPLSAVNWSVSGTDGTHIATFSSGTLRYQSDTTSPQLSVSCNAIAASIPAGTYEVTVVVSNYVSGGVKVFENTGASGILTVNGVGTFTGKITVLANAGLAVTRTTTNVDLTISSVSLKLLYGNHATQATAINRPVLSARVNLLTKTEQFNDVVWAKSRCSITQTTASSPIGTLTACKVTEDTQNNAHAIVGGSAEIVSGVAYTYSVYAQPAERSYIRLTLPQTLFGGATTDSGATFNLSGGALQGSADANVTASIQSAGNNWYRCSITMTATVTGTLNLARIYVAIQAGTSYLGDGTSGLYIWGASIVTSNQASIPYQRVNTSTDYDTVGFKPYLKFGGTNSSMSTSAIDFTATDKMMVCAGVRGVTTTGVQQIFQTSASYSANTGSLELSLNEITAGGFTAARFNGTNTQYKYEAVGAQPRTSVLTITNDYSTAAPASAIVLRENGTVPAGITSGGAAGTYTSHGNYPVYIGSVGGLGSFFNGNLYGLIIRGAASSAAQINSTELFMNSKTGAY